MSLSDRLKERKAKLTHAKTKVRTAEGKVYEEEFLEGAHHVTSNQQDGVGEVSPGYVIDAEPDLQVSLFINNKSIFTICERKRNNINHLVSFRWPK